MYLYIRMGVSIVVNIFITRIVLQSLGNSDYGLYNVVGGAISMLGFLSASMTVATQRFLNYAEGEGDHERIKVIFNNSLLIHQLLAIFTVIILLIAGFFFFNGILVIPKGREMAAIFVYGSLLFSTVYSITTTPYEATLNSHENMLYYSLLGIVDVFLKFLIALMINWTEADKLVVYAILMALESWAFRTLNQLYCKKHYQECQGISIRKYFDKSLIKEMIGFASWNLISVATGMISLYGMNIVINHYFGTELNAAMGVAIQLSGVLMAVSSNMLKALTPIMMKKEGAHQREQMLKITYIGCKFSYLLYAFVCFPILFCLPFLLKVWLKVVPNWTVVFCLLLIISTLIEQVTVFLYQSIAAQGNIKNFNIVKSIINISPILISLYLLGYCGFAPYWALVSWGFCKALLGGITNVFFSKKNLNLDVHIYSSKVLCPCVLVTSMVCCINYAMSNILCEGNIEQFIVFCLMFLLSIPVYWCVGLNKQERYTLSHIILKR